MVFAFFSLFFLPEEASESHHIIALNQINVTEGSKGKAGGAIRLCRFFHGTTTASSLVSLICFL